MSGVIGLCSLQSELKSCGFVKLVRSVKVLIAGDGSRWISRFRLFRTRLKRDGLAERADCQLLLYSSFLWFCLMECRGCI